MKKVSIFLFLFISNGLLAQDIDLQKMADSLDALNNAGNYANYTFKAIQIINFPTNETMGKRGLDFTISHRFGEFATGNGNPAYNAFGLDIFACIRLSLDYGIRDWLQVGIGRSSLDKMADATCKIRCFRQTLDNHVPVSMTLQTKMNWTALQDPNKAFTGVDKYHYPVDRLSYATTLIIARKFGDRLSLELNEFYVHYNIVDHATDRNDIIATGISGRYKLNKRFALTFEYAHRINKYSLSYDTYHDPLGIGFDLETGGHVFQVHFTNQYGMNEAQYIPYTKSDWLKGNIRLGFNISRVWGLKPHKK